MVGAGIYVYRAKFFYHALVRGNDGICKIWKPILVAEENDAPQTHGRLLRTLVESAEHHPITVMNDAEVHPLLKAAEVESWDQLDMNSRYCSIEQVNDQLRLIPSRTHDDGNHLFDPDNAIVIDVNAEDVSLGNDIFAAISLCT